MLPRITQKVAMKLKEIVLSAFAAELAIERNRAVEIQYATAKTNNFICFTQIEPIVVVHAPQRMRKKSLDKIYQKTV